jgi:IS5 family transposase
MHLSIDSSNILTIFDTNKKCYYFTLKEGSKHLQSVVDKLDEIDSLIDWKSVSIISESIIFNKTVFWERPESDVIIMFKRLVL